MVSIVMKNIKGRHGMLPDKEILLLHCGEAHIIDEPTIPSPRSSPPASMHDSEQFAEKSMANQPGGGSRGFPRLVLCRTGLVL
jgi:hypothetical protein